MSSLTPTIEDLQLSGTSRPEFLKAIRTNMLISMLSTIVLWTLLFIAGTTISLVILMFVLVAELIVVFQFASRRVMSVAKQRRSDMDLATAVFLDLINVLLAGGAGIETAILAAAACGDGWGFSQIRLSIAKSQSSRSSYWDGLRELGMSIGNDSLVDVANSVQLAGEHGARIRESLAAKATTLRQKNLARIEYEAEERTEKMGLPIVSLFLGFILLIGYPAFVGTIGAL